MYSTYSCSRQNTSNAIVTDKLFPSKVNIEAQYAKKNDYQEQPRKSHYRESLSELLNVLNDSTCYETFVSVDNCPKSPQDSFMCRKSKDENFPPFIASRSSMQLAPSITLRANASRDLKRPEVRRSCAYRCYPSQQVSPSRMDQGKLRESPQFTRQIKSEMPSRCTPVTNPRNQPGPSSKMKKSFGNRHCQRAFNTDREMAHREAFFSYPPELVGVYGNNKPPILLPSNIFDLSSESCETAPECTPSGSFSKEMINCISSRSSAPKPNNYYSAHTRTPNLKDELWLLRSNRIINSDSPACSTNKEVDSLNDDECIIPTRDNEKRRGEDCGCHSCRNFPDAIKCPAVSQSNDTRVYQRTKPVVSYSSPNTMVMQHVHNAESKRRTRNLKQIGLQQPCLASNNETGDSVSPENLEGNVLPRHCVWNRRTPSWHVESNKYSTHKESSGTEKKVIQETIEDNIEPISSSSFFESVSTVSALKPQPTTVENLDTKIEKKQPTTNNVHNHIYLSCIDAFSLPTELKTSQHCLPISELIYVVQRDRHTIVKRHSTPKRARMSIRSKMRNKRRMFRKRNNTPLKYCRTSDTLQISTKPSKRRNSCTLPINLLKFNTTETAKYEKTKPIQAPDNACDLLIKIENQLTSNKNMTEKLHIFESNLVTGPTTDTMKLLNKIIERCRGYVQSHCNSKVAIENMNDTLLMPVLTLYAVVNEEKVTLIDHDRQSCLNAVQGLDNIVSTLNHQKHQITELTRTIFSLLNNFAPDGLEKKTTTDSTVVKPPTPRNISKLKSLCTKNERSNTLKKKESPEMRTSQTSKSIQNDFTSTKLKTLPKSTGLKSRSKDKSITENRVEMPDKKSNAMQQRPDVTKTAKKPVSKTPCSKESTLHPKVEANAHTPDGKVIIVRSKPASNNPLPVWRPAGVSKLPATVSATVVQKHRPTPWSSGKERVAPSTDNTKSLLNKQINPSEPVNPKPPLPKALNKSLEFREGRMTKICQCLADTKIQQRLKSGQSGSTKDLSIETSNIRIANKTSESVLKKSRSNLKTRPGTPRNVKYVNEISTCDIEVSEKCDEPSPEAVTKLSQSTTVVSKAEVEALHKLQIDRSSTFEEIRARFSEMTLVQKTASNTKASKSEVFEKTDPDLQREISSSNTDDFPRNIADSIVNTEILIDSGVDHGTSTCLLNDIYTAERSTSLVAISEVASSKCCQVSFDSSASVLNASDDQLAQLSDNVEENVSRNSCDEESDREVPQKHKRKSANRHSLSLDVLKEFLCDQGVSVELVNKAEQDVLLKHQDRKKSTAKLSCSPQHTKSDTDKSEPIISTDELTFISEGEKNTIQEGVSIIPVIFQYSDNEQNNDGKYLVVKHENTTSTKKIGNNVSSQTNRRWEQSSCSQTAATPNREMSTETVDLISKAEVATEVSVHCKSIDTMPEPVHQRAHQMQTEIIESSCKNSQTLNTEKRSVAIGGTYSDLTNLSSPVIQNEKMQEKSQCYSSKFSYSSCHSSIESLSDCSMKNLTERHSKESVTNRVPRELITAFRIAEKRAQNLFTAIEIYKNTLPSQTSLKEEQTEIMRNSSPRTCLTKLRISRKSNITVRDSELSVNCIIDSSTNFDESDNSEEELEFQETRDVEWADKQVAVKPCNSLVLLEVKSLMQLMLDRIKDNGVSAEDYYIQKVSHSDEFKYPHRIVPFHKNEVDSLTILTRENLLHLIYGTICSIVFWCLQFSITCES